MASVFITGATGFMGRRLSAELVARGHSVRGLVRRGSEKLLALGCEGVTGDPLDASTYQKFVTGCDALVHLVGVPHPSPAKKQQFRSIDLASATQAIAAVASGVQHMVTSAWPYGTVMRDYVAARREAEDAIRKARVNATILRPWYVLGAGEARAAGDCADLLAAGSVALHSRIRAAAGAGERGADDRDHDLGDRGSAQRRAGLGSAGDPAYGNMIRARSSSSVRTGTPSSCAFASLVPASSPTTT